MDSDLALSLPLCSLSGPCHQGRTLQVARQIRSCVTTLHTATIELSILVPSRMPGFTNLFSWCCCVTTCVDLFRRLKKIILTEFESHCNCHCDNVQKSTGCIPGNALPPALGRHYWYHPSKYNRYKTRLFNNANVPEVLLVAEAPDRCEPTLARIPAPGPSFNFGCHLSGQHKEPDPARHLTFEHLRCDSAST